MDWEWSRGSLDLVFIVVVSALLGIVVAWAWFVGGPRADRGSGSGRARSEDSPPHQITEGIGEFSCSCGETFWDGDTADGHAEGHVSAAQEDLVSKSQVL